MSSPLIAQRPPAAGRVSVTDGSTGKPRARRSVEWIAFLLLSYFFFCVGVPEAWRTLNTDFPNYYLAARLSREGVDTSRAYEWIWLAREKDHREIDQRIVGLVPITPFSTLAIRPFAGLGPLEAKHAWLLVNLALLPLIAYLLSTICRVSLLEASIVLGATYPLYRNLLYGQFYILLLALLCVALWALQRRKNRLAGAMVGIAIALKIFPVLLTLHFIRKRNWTALWVCGLTFCLSALVSVAVFGWSMHRTYILEVLPWTLRGEVLNPYALGSSSLSTLLHRLFVYEPQWNPNPALNAPWLLVVIHPVIQVGLLLLVLLRVDPEDQSPVRFALEWSALLVATLTLTPLPASYHFTVLALPIAVICAHLVRQRKWALLAFATLIYLAIGFHGWNTTPVDGWLAILHVPRLFGLFLLTGLTLHLLQIRVATLSMYTDWWWTAAASLLVLASIASGLIRQRHLFDEYRYRLPTAANILIATRPESTEGKVHAIALGYDGYGLSSFHDGKLRIDKPFRDTGIDQLASATLGGVQWLENSGSHSTIERSDRTSTPIENAESPSISGDGGRLVFLREMSGRKQLILRDLTLPRAQDRLLTVGKDNEWNVEETTFAPDGSLFFSATKKSGRPGLYVASLGRINALELGEARYPAVSPDGEWLAFSRFGGRYWNLYLMNLKSGATSRLGNVPCNEIEASWEQDSKTLLYGSDCGRALWFTAVSRRQVFP